MELQFNHLKTNKMKNTIEQIRILALTTGNSYLLNKINILEIEIQTEIANQKSKLINKVIELPF